MRLLPGRRRRTAQRAFVPAPAPIGGSLEHFAHFLLGYLAPVMAELEGADSRPRAIAVADCGPLMNRLFPYLTGSGVDEVVVVPERRVAAHAPRGATTAPFRFDRPEGHDRALLDRARAFALAQLAHHRPCPEAVACQDAVVVVRRSPSPAFFRPGGPAQISGYGTDRREITNLDAVHRALVEAGHRAVVLEPGAHGPACQVHAFSRARGVVGQRGADLANLLWMSSSQFLVVADPPEMAALPPVTVSLTATLGIPAVMLPMPGLHAPVAPEDVVRAVAAMPSP